MYRSVTVENQTHMFRHASIPVAQLTFHALMCPSG